MYTPDDLNLLEKLQEATTNDVDEEKGSFKNGDKVTYNMLGGGLTDADLMRTLGTAEHILRADHNGAKAEIVETIGEVVSRYSIVFEDGFAIANLAPSELVKLEEDKVEERRYHVGFIRQDGETSETTIDAINHEGAIEKVKADSDVKEILTITLVEESKTNEAEDATDTMQPQEKPDIKAEDCNMEDLSDVDLEKTKGSSEESGNAIRSVDDKELVVEPDKVVEPKKESKTNEKAIREEKCPKCGSEFFAEGNEAGDYMCAECGYDESVDEKITDESKIKEEETEFAPSRAEMKNISDDQLKKLHKNARKSEEYWTKDRTAPEKMHAASAAVTRYEEEMVKRGLLTGVEVPESRYSFMKNREPLWLCNECHKTFRSNESVCTLCESTKTEKISEQTDVLTKEVFKVTWLDTKTREPGSTTVMAYDKADAKREAKRSNRDIVKVEGPITEASKEESKETVEKSEIKEEKYQVESMGGTQYDIEFNDDGTFYISADGGRIAEGEWSGAGTMSAKILGPEELIDFIAELLHEGDYQIGESKEESKVPFDGSPEGAVESKLHEVKDWECLECGHKFDKDVPKSGEMKCPKCRSTDIDVCVESKLKEGVHELVGNVPGIDPEEQAVLRKAIEDGSISNEWPSEEQIVDTLVKAQVDPTIVDDADMGELRQIYLKHILLTKAMKMTKVASESKEIEPITVIEIVRSEIDPEAYNIRVVELPEGNDIVILDSVSDRTKALERGKELARALNAKFLGIIDEKKVNEEKCPKCGSEFFAEGNEAGDYMCAECGYDESVDESKLKEQEEVKSFRVWYKDPSQARLVKMKHEFRAFTSQDAEKAARMLLDKEAPGNEFEIAKSELIKNVKEQEEDTFHTLAKGFTDREDADKLAKEKEGQVIQDEEDETKFAVVVRSTQ